MMRARFNRQVATSKQKDFLFEQDDDEMHGFEDIEDDMDDASESYMRQ